MRTRRWIQWGGCVAAISIAACSAPEQSAPTPEHSEAQMEMNPKAVELAHRFLLIDTHIDVPYRLNDHPEDVSGRTEKGDFDFPRAVAGGLDVPFMSIYVPAAYQETGGAKDFADEMIALVEGLVANHPDKFTMVASADEAAAIVGSGKVGFAMGIENGAPIEGDLDQPEALPRQGSALHHADALREQPHLRFVVRRPSGKWNGLSPFGRELIGEMNEDRHDDRRLARLGRDACAGVRIDASSRDRIALLLPPLHAGLGAQHERRVDRRAVGDNGGVVQINFGSAFLREDSQEQGSANTGTPARRTSPSTNSTRTSEETRGVGRGVLVGQDQALRRRHRRRRSHRPRRRVGRRRSRGYRLRLRRGGGLTPDRASRTSRSTPT